MENQETLMVWRVTWGQLAGLFFLLTAMSAATGWTVGRLTRPADAEVEGAISIPWGSLRAAGPGEDPLPAPHGR